MLQFVLHKIKNKKWLNLCLLTGISLLAAVFACHPMFLNGAYDSILQTAFEEYAKDNQEFPAVLQRSGSYDAAEYPDAQSVLDRLDAYEAKWTQYVDVDTVASQQYLKLSGDNTRTNLGKDNLLLYIGLLKDMEEHVQIVKGEGLSDADTGDENLFPCLISEQIMDECDLVVGEEITFPYAQNEAGDAARFVIVGIFAQASQADNYWYRDLSDYEHQIFVSQEVFDIMLSDYGYSSVAFEENLMLDYTEINGQNAFDYLDYIRQFQEADASFSTNLVSTLEDCRSQSRTAGVILFALEVPGIVLLFLFIYMVSGQVLSSEEGEIAVLRSRGVTRGQAMRLYIMQSLILSLGGVCIGTLLGFGMCRAAASTDAFLHFVRKDVSLYRFRWSMVGYAACAAGIAMIFMTVPVWKRSRMTIVEQKNTRVKTGGKPFWEKCFLDVILLGISCYLLYNYRKQTDALSLALVSGQQLDPMILLDAPLFIFSCGLVFLRLTKYLTVWICRMGKKHWRAPMFASFLQITRTFQKQSIISVFLIMTIACGIFDAGMARTVNENSEERIAYNTGTDIRLTEKWKLNTYRLQSGELVWYYDEPDFERYTKLVETGVCESVTRVLEDDGVTVSAGGGILTACQLMGISTKEFGETASLLDGLNDTHWFYALNALAENRDGVIISSNMAKALGLSVGDSLSYTRNAPVGSGEEMGEVSATVCAILDCFPGYEQYDYENDSGQTVENENYLLVCNYATVCDAFEMTPYSVWMRLADGASGEQVQAFVEEQDITLTGWLCAAEEIEENKSSALIQITNGMFTMIFGISMFVCAVGFLLYWTMSIKSRELLLGVCRAMGMRMREIRSMLFNEQIFCSLLPMLAGGGTGILAVRLFTKLLAIVYLPERHNIAIRIYVSSGDMQKLCLVLAAVVLVCFFILRRLLRGLKVTQALKLGED